MFLNWLRTCCVVSMTTVATRHIRTANFWADFEHRVRLELWRKYCNFRRPPTGTLLIDRAVTEAILIPRPSDRLQETLIITTCPSSGYRAASALHLYSLQFAYCCSSLNDQHCICHYFFRKKVRERMGIGIRT